MGVPPPPGLGLAVVIPAFNEPDLLRTLFSLWSCTRPAAPAEVIIIINSPAGCAEAICQQNARTFQEATAWASRHQDARLRFHVLHLAELPVREAGVGLARKIGMDEAVRRFADLSLAEAGVIACLDADCQCDPNYLVALETHFVQSPRTPGCSIYFEHPLDDVEDPGLQEAIAQYELHLRYYVQALRYSGFPYAHHTVGSAMAVRVPAYLRQGGMNKRQAGEDFYFLQKIMPLGGFTDLTSTRVMPSPRASARVPFGTGRAMREFLAGRPVSSYAWESFLELKAFWGCVQELMELPSFAGSCAEARTSPALRHFLVQEDFDRALEEIQANTSSRESFRKRFFSWFNGFRVMKFLNVARDRFYGPRPVALEATKLLTARNPGGPLPGCGCRELLVRFRQLDRAGGNLAFPEGAHAVQAG